MSNSASPFKVPERVYILEEVARHNKNDDLWNAVKGVVMDLSNWLDEHPGGPQVLFSHIGRDATEGECFGPSPFELKVTVCSRISDAS